LITRRFAPALAALFVALGCRSGNSPGAPGGTPSAAAPASKRPVFLRGPTGGADVAPFIANELRKGHTDRHGVVVYVGATWCEPCQGFHHAVLNGEFDELLAGVRLVEFDLDADRDALGRAGYSSRLIPLFALPKNDGTSSDRRIEGSVKGSDAVHQNLMPRLRAFLAGQMNEG
jgi:hypothetical protein